MNLHVNSSLPRSGSELMQALLAQHPDVYASPTSPLLEFWFGAQGNFNTSEVKSQNRQMMVEAFSSFVKEGTKGYYSAITDKPVVVDKSRGWLEHADLLWRIFPEAKVVTMVRDVNAIVASLERIYRANAGHPETRHLPKTAEQRANFWKKSGSLPLGLALDRLHDRQSRGPDNRIMYVRYEDLCASPVEVMKRVFVHLGLEPIEIDRYNINKSAPEDDSHYGIFGSHQLRPTI
jgi:sulfotransferase